LWTPGDWNAFFGFGTNILVNMLVLTGPLEIRAEDAGYAWCSAASFPRSGLMMCLSTFYLCVAGLSAWRRRTGRSDVCALPSGVSVPHMFIVTFVIMLPITIEDRLTR
jgi:AGZA family xanthine/uracil permease-like MFS transporter